MTDIVLIDTIADVDPAEWDELTKGHVTASHGWLRLVEETALEQRPCRCLLARENSRLQAAIFYWEHRRNDSRSSIDYVVFGRLAPMAHIFGVTMLPAAVAAETSGHRETILFREDLSGSDRRRLTTHMLDFLEETAIVKKQTICFRGIPADDADLAEVFSRRGYLRSPEFPACCLDIRWHSFTEYLVWLRKRHPNTEKNIRRELSKSRRAGVTFQRMNDPAAAGDRLHALTDAHYRRLNGRPFPFHARFFEQIQAKLGDRATIFTAAKDGVIIGMQLRLSNCDTAGVPIIGIDAEHARRDAVYFNLGYNNAIHHAIEDGLRQVRFGTLVYDTKIRRGCRLVQTNMYLRPGNVFHRLLMRPLIAARTARMHQVLRSRTGNHAAPGTENPNDDGSLQS